MAKTLIDLPRGYYLHDGAPVNLPKWAEEQCCVSCGTVEHENPIILAFERDGKAKVAVVCPDCGKKIMPEEEILKRGKEIDSGELDMEKANDWVIEKFSAFPLHEVEIVLNPLVAMISAPREQALSLMERLNAAAVIEDNYLELRPVRDSIWFEDARTEMLVVWYDNRSIVALQRRVYDDPYFFGTESWLDHEALRAAWKAADEDHKAWLQEVIMRRLDETVRREKRREFQERMGSITNAFAGVLD